MAVHNHRLVGKALAASPRGEGSESTTPIKPTGRGVRSECRRGGELKQSSPQDWISNASPVNEDEREKKTIERKRLESVRRRKWTTLRELCLEGGRAGLGAMSGGGGGGGGC